MQGQSNAADLEGLARSQLVGPTPRVLAPHVARRLVTVDDRRVVSTLDAGIQTIAEAAERQLTALEGRVERCGWWWTAQRRGAHLGNRRHALQRASSTVRAPRRPDPRSPFLYQLAIEQRMLTAASLLDSPSTSSRRAGCTCRRTTITRSRGW